MASYTSIQGSPIGAFRHDLRERSVYKNDDIDPLRSHLNYVLSEHGGTSKECMDFYDSLLEGVYHREGKTVTTGEWCVQMPTDLDPSREEEFFRSAFEFIDRYTFGDSDSRCILAAVHRDEAGESHLHYVFTFPETENKKYIDPQSKFLNGMKKSMDKYDLKLDRSELQLCFDVLHRYEDRRDSHRERDAIQELSQLLSLRRDDARWVFTRIRRLESERYEYKLMPKDEFLNRKYFDSFHPAFQKWMDDHGFDCTVYKGGGGINLTVDQLKEITRQTGKTLDRGLSVESISHLINDNSRLQGRVEELEKQVEKQHEHVWGDTSGWGGSSLRDREIAR